MRRIGSRWPFSRLASLSSSMGPNPTFVVRLASPENGSPRLRSSATGLRISALVLCLVGCVLQRDVDDVAAGQVAILTTLDKLMQPKPAVPMPMPHRPDPQRRHHIAFDPAHARGANDPWVTITLVSDLESPKSRALLATAQSLVREWEDETRMVIAHFPMSFHRRALAAALACECAADQGSLWQMHDFLVGAPDFSPDFSGDKLAAHARALKLDVEVWKKCVAEETHRPQIDAGVTTLRTLGVRAAPAVFVNGRYMEQTPTPEDLTAIVGQEIKTARDSGVAKQDYYRKVVQEPG